MRKNTTTFKQLTKNKILNRLRIDEMCFENIPVFRNWTRPMVNLKTNLTRKFFHNWFQQFNSSSSSLLFFLTKDDRRKNENVDSVPYNNQTWQEKYAFQSVYSHSSIFFFLLHNIWMLIYQQLLLCPKTNQHLYVDTASLREGTLHRSSICSSKVKER